MEYKDMQFPTRQDMRNEIARLAAEVETLQSLIPHPGDGSCEQCGAVPATAVETVLCEECRGLSTWRKEPPDDQAFYAALQKIEDCDECGPEISISLL